ncbi:hypothetical protein EGR_06670 [Echinococcus granulosus]|uniref:Uncharacterized protein n=1 Tax=Echinococcus granulosus TaxID=6210 RepID=W6UY55_ECHGR|nr:hypothetical protein EGR_06670 [Echinococcus granulosus]EUB58489.1 hypothetical protein EGR_06670 [Echinococcus granulosus]
MTEREFLLLPKRCHKRLKILRKVWFFKNDKYVWLVDLKKYTAFMVEHFTLMLIWCSKTTPCWVEIKLQILLICKRAQHTLSAAGMRLVFVKGKGMQESKGSLTNNHPFKSKVFGKNSISIRHVHLSDSITISFGQSHLSIANLILDNFSFFGKKLLDDTPLLYFNGN